jgi:hypothetical protein
MLRGLKLAVFFVSAGGLGALGCLGSCGEQAPPPNARDTLNKNEKSISESLDKFQVEQDERDKPGSAATPPAVPANKSPVPAAPSDGPGK